METSEEEPRARAVLAKHAIAALRTVDVSETEKCVVLNGRLGSYYQKQMAQEAVRRVADGRQIDNRIQVA